MHLLLVRHGESTDNVANLYAGSRDAPLTNHGVLQARRLAEHLLSPASEAESGCITHIFTSNLQRAYKTAGAVADAQARSINLDGGPPYVADVVQLTELREKDFGSSEGKRFGTKSTAINKETTLEPARSDEEAPAAMVARVNRFIDVHLFPIIEQYSISHDRVLVVAHGIILNYLLRALNTRFGGMKLENNATWSNTGVLQALVRAHKGDRSRDTNSKSDELRREKPSSSRSAPGSTPPPQIYTFIVQSINNVDHLKGLKKTRGGVGSAKFDPRQRTMDSFFTSTAKKRKAEGEAERDST
ncbi:Xaa-Pro aminopeptidase P [Apiospora arundinis]|uniref:Histidine phosphatase superfamily n=1 Tax=Apiospora arundinis TaxID=335852 RepID=A0ABR2IG34_9PEZI